MDTSNGLNMKGEAPDTPHRPMPEMNRQRQKLVSWFKTKAPALGELYEGSLRLVYDQTFPGRYRLVAHAVREIRNRLPDVISGPRKGAKLETKNRLNELVMAWKRAGLSFDGVIPLSVTRGPEISNTVIKLPQRLFREIVALLNDHNKVSERKEDIASRLFEGIAPENKQLRNYLVPIANNWINVTEWFVDRTHETSNERTDINERQFIEKFELFETILIAMVGIFDRVIKDLDKILEDANKKTPTPDLVNKAIALIGHLEARRYFFDHLENPNWIGYLKDFFKTPPALRNEKGETIGFPQWPESRCLARMAKQAPNEVLWIALNITETDNALVHSDLIDAALAMPADLAAQLAERETEWIKKQVSLYLLLPAKYAALFVHIAKGGQTEPALRLAEALLDIHPDERYKDVEELQTLAPEPKAKFDSWHYEEILDEHFPKLVKAAEVPAFDLICNLLNKTIRILTERYADKESEDHSDIWRPEIEHERYRDIKDCLVSGVRDTAKSLLDSGKATIPGLVEKLEKKQKWQVFHRIALHLLRRPEAPQELVQQRVVNRERFRQLPDPHEYGMLLKDKFAALTPEQQQTVLSWVEEGPDLQAYKEGHERWTGNPATPEEVARYQKQWQRDKLAWLEASLPDEWKKRYKDLVKETGEAVTARYIPTIRAGHRSPKTYDELRAMSIEELVTFIRTWEPSGSIIEASKEGLGQELTAVVSHDPLRYAKETEKLKGLPLGYLHDILAGYYGAVREKREVDWAAVLELCQWIVEQFPATIRTETGQEEINNERKWTRHTIADLLSSGLEDGPVSTPYELRKMVWKILEPLSDDPDPPKDKENATKEPEEEPDFRAINTVRGEALHAVIRYALWVRRHHDKTSEAKEKADKGFEEMPEVRHVLEQHLDMTQDRSLAIRTVYGQWFPWLVLLDKNWAQRQITNVFPESESDRDYLDAAWETYIIYCEAYDQVFEVLRNEYEKAIKRLGTLKERKGRLANPEERLAEHLMTLLWRSKLDKALLHKFYERASAGIKAHAIEYIGRSLKNTEGDVPQEFLKPIMALWENRIEEAKKASDRKNYQEEIAAFGWWFTSEKLDDEWAIQELVKALETAQMIQPDFWVMEHLAQLAPRKPREAVQCLKYIIEANREHWSLYGIRNRETMDILKAVLQSDDGEAKRIAEDEIIDTLLRMGRMEFRDLIKT